MAAGAPGRNPSAAIGDFSHPMQPSARDREASSRSALTLRWPRQHRERLQHSRVGTQDGQGRAEAPRVVAETTMQAVGLTAGRHCDACGATDAAASGAQPGWRAIDLDRLTASDS